LLYYVLALIFAFGISVPIFRHLLFSEIDTRVRQDMAEELEDFRELLSGSEIEDPEAEDGADGDGADAGTPSTFLPVRVSHLTTGFEIPTTPGQLEEFFESYLAHHIPEDDVFYITFVDGKFYKSSPKARPKDLGIEAALMQRWAQQSEAERGEYPSEDSEIGKILYLVEPVVHGDRSLGVFVIAHTTAGERAEGLAATAIAGRVAISALLLALVLLWLAVGRVLRPLRTLTATVESIGETDLTQRIAVQGEDELARLSARFNDMMDRLETAFVSQRNFVNDAGHELRTPIAIVRGHLELMDADSLEQQETLALVLDELDRMSRIVSDLILLAKSQRTDFLHLETVEVAALTQALFAKARALGPRNWCLEEVATGRMVADPQRITQAMMNLAHNATQHTKSSDTIALGSAMAEGKVYFWVRDTGEGIPPDDQKRIFERFARVTHKRRRSEGAGLGLSIVQAIAEAHSGQVTLQSQLGAGATFTIVLPLEPDQH
jgi:signal transduction histidine kinase